MKSCHELQFVSVWEEELASISKKREEEQAYILVLDLSYEWVSLKLKEIPFIGNQNHVQDEKEDVYPVI